MPDERYQEFTGTLPYASELFGVYQPLLGWRGKQAQQRMYKEQLALAEQVARRMLNDSRVHQLIQAEVMVISPDHPLPAAIPAWMKSVAANQVQLAVKDFIGTSQRAPARQQEWANVLNVASMQVAELLNAPSSVAASPATVAVFTNSDRPTPGSPLQESIVFGMLDYLSRNSPETLRALFVQSQKRWEATKEFINSHNDFHPDIRDTVLSPIGIITLYREYFFEFNTFLGPPVEHVWVSPGGSVELFEIHTRRTITEKQIEAATEMTTRTEVTTTMQDEISDAIKQENQENEKLGTSASGGVNFPVWKAQASINYERDEAQSTAEETTHKVMRQQSEKLSNEIRRSFKTVFKTVLETEDTFSRRYVIQNPTDKLANYELRRKMRQVGVQVQHIGTQLCWQVYIDDPGKDLGIAELVHVAKPDDLATGIQPPDAPTPLQPKETELKVNFPFEVIDGDRSTDEWYEAMPGNPDILQQQDSPEMHIKATHVYMANPPGPGYALNHVEESSIERVDHDKDLPDVDASYEVTDPQSGAFLIRLHLVNFWDQPEIRFALKLIWSPPDQKAAVEDYQRKLNEFHERERREVHAQYVQLVRERIKLVRGIQPRDEKILREEERSVVSGRIIRQLTRIAPDESPQTVHVMSELIEQIFEVDKLLYFVAPYWWMPQTHNPPPPFPGPSINPAAVKPFRPAVALRESPVDGDRGGTDRGDRNGGNGGSTGGGGSPPGGPEVPPPAPSSLPSPTQPDLLTEDDLVGWDGFAPNDPRPNYLITEDSAPAPMGASLGWLLQLDGDQHRNAFLNSPWVKAVLPIRPCMEMAALDWLMHEHVEGTEGLDETLRQKIINLAQQVCELNGEPQASSATETVFENGFNPLAGGFRAPGTPQLPDGSPAQPGTPYVIFAQWIEILPTNQVVAVEYHPEEHGA